MREYQYFENGDVMTVSIGTKLLKLTEEEEKMEITLERFHEWESIMGEDFIDYNDSITNPSILEGFLIAKHPDYAENLINYLNSDDFYIGDFIEIFLDDLDLFYGTLAEYANLTVNTKKENK